MLVKNLLKEKGISQKDLAAKIGVSAGALSQMMSENANPNLKTLERIASALGVSVSELFERPAKGVISCPYCGKEISVEAAKIEKREASTDE